MPENSTRKSDVRRHMREHGVSYTTAMRTLDAKAKLVTPVTREFDELGYGAADVVLARQALSAAFERTGSITLIVGPMGSGKSTTVAAVFAYAKSLGFTCDADAAASLYMNTPRRRQHSDAEVYYAGEIDDRRSALDAIRRADGGHVVAIMHVSYAPNALLRFAELAGVPDISVIERVAVVLQQMSSLPQGESGQQGRRQLSTFMVTDRIVDLFRNNQARQSAIALRGAVETTAATLGHNHIVTRVLRGVAHGDRRNYVDVASAMMRTRESEWITDSITATDTMMRTIKRHLQLSILDRSELATDKFVSAARLAITAIDVELGTVRTAEAIAGQLVEDALHHATPAQNRDLVERVWRKVAGLNLVMSPHLPQM